MSSVELQHITKRFRRVTALSDVSFDVRDGEFFVLLGPTGAGKTTTLRVVAGLERQETGNVLFDGEVMNDTPPADRDVAFVFQQYSLYPTMTVYDNLAFPLRSPLRRLPEPEIRRRVLGAAEKLRIGRLLERQTGQLSGGEMQRVALGRALVRQPAVFLMDEPLSNLDFKLREALRVEIKHLQKTQSSTTLFVTHDQVEALTMADRIGVLNQGRIVQIGTPQDIYDRPATTFVAQLVGTPRINLLEADHEDGMVLIARSPLRLSLPAVPTNLPARFILGIRPEDIKLHSDGTLAGRVGLIEPLGVETVLHIRAGEQTLISTAPGMLRIGLGDEVRFSVASERLHLFGPDGRRISTRSAG